MRPTKRHWMPAITTHVLFVPWRQITKYPLPLLKRELYRHISGNQATAWGLLAAAERAGKKLCIMGPTPLLQPLTFYTNSPNTRTLGVITLQAEDEIAAVCSSIGASYAGQIGVTASAGPGIALKGEAIGLAVMAEIPLVVIDVQRGGPSTGLAHQNRTGRSESRLYTVEIVIAPVLLLRPAPPVTALLTFMKPCACPFST